jgi:hypothetical protein
MSTDSTPPSKDTMCGLKGKIQQSAAYRRPISLTETNTGRRFTKPMAPENRQE